MRKKIKNRRFGRKTSILKNDKLILKLALGVSMSCVVAAFGFILGFVPKMSSIKTELSEQLYQNEEYQDYYQRSIVELDQLKKNNVINDNEYERLKIELKNAIRYVENLSEEDRAEFQQYLDEYYKYSNIFLATSASSIALGLVGIIVGLTKNNKIVNDFFDNLQKKRSVNNANNKLSNVGYSGNNYYGNQRNGQNSSHFSYDDEDDNDYFKRDDDSTELL